MSSPGSSKWSQAEADVEDGNQEDATMKEELKHTEPSSSEEGSVRDVELDPYFAFIPKLANYGARIVGGEIRNVKNAVTGFPSWSKNYTKETYDFYRENPRILYKELISGFTVAIMQVPESIAFSFVAGVPPQSGLHATFWMAAITGVLGGKPGMISGAAGALAVVLADLTVDDGVLDYLTETERLSVLFMTMFVCGIMQILFAIFRLAKLVRLIPETGMIGFMNGLAIIIFMAQLPAFQKCTEYPLFVECSVNQREWLTFTDDTWTLILSLVHVFGCMLIMKYFPKVPKVGKIVPASLVALLVGTLFEHTLFRKGFGVETRTVAETATMSGSFPEFDWPKMPNDSKTMSTMFTYAITLAAIGAVESVLTLQACNEITDTVPKVSDSNQELFAQGLGNAVSAMFQAIGGDAMIGQSTINIMNGARHRVSSTSSGVFILLFVVALSSFIDLLPVSTLTGVLFMVVLSTFQWQTFRILRYGRLSDSGVVLIVTLVAIFVNLAIAIAAGVIFSALVHAWDSGALVSADIVHKPMAVNGKKCFAKYVHIKGSIFFGSARHFVEFFSVTDDPETVIIDFTDALIVDHSAVAAIHGITHRFAKVGKRVLLTNLPYKSHGRLQRTGDHAVLRRQITDVGVIKTVKSVDEEEREEPPTSDSDGSAEVHPHTLQELPMFQGPVEDVEVELGHLQDELGQFSIHSIKSGPFGGSRSFGGSGSFERS